MSERQSQRTLIYVTNGLALTPSDAHEGTVTIGLSATNPAVNSVLSWNGTQFVWTTISSISTLSWTTTGNQTGLTGTKSGSYNLVTTGDITCDTLNYTTLNPAIDLSGLWALDGQVLGVKRTLGSTDNFDIGFITNNLERLTILNGGNVGIGNIAPLAYLHIKAGTAAASTSPLKLTSGVNLTAPEAGAFEYDGTRLYFTPVAARETLAFLSDLTSGYVPYTGATADVDLGFFGLTTNSLTVQNDFSIISVADNVFLNQLTIDKDLTIRYNDGGVTKNAFFIDASAAQMAIAGTTIASGYTVSVVGNLNASSDSFPVISANRTGQVLDLSWTTFTCDATKASDAGDGFGSAILSRFTDTGGTFTLGLFGYARDGGDRKGRFYVQTNNGTVADNARWKFQIRPDGTTYFGDAAAFTLPTACTRIDLNGTLHVVTDVGMTVGTGGDFQVSLSSDNVLMENLTSNKNITVRVNKGGVSTDLFLFNGTSGSVVVLDNIKLNFRDSDIGIYCQADTFLDLFADGLIRLGNSSAGAPTTYLAINPGADTYWIGDGSGLAFGEMYGNNVSQTVVITVADTFVEIDGGFTGGELNLVTFPDDHYLQVSIAGRYRVDYSISAQTAAVANKEMESAIMINGVASVKGTSHAEVSPGGSGRPETVSGHAILDLAANSQISLAVSNHTDTTDFVVEHMSVVVQMVGGT